MNISHIPLVVQASFARSLALAACLATFVIGDARSVDAQPARGDGLYVSGAALGDLKRFSGDPDTNILDGEAFGGAITLGTSVSPRWDLEVGVEVPRFTTNLQPRVLTVRRSTITLQSRTRNQPLSVTTLVRFRGATRGRVQLGYLGGLSVLRLQRRFDTEAPADTPASLIASPHALVQYGTAPTLGVDARVALAGHLSLVPALHVTAFSLQDIGGVLVRPRIAIRWTF
ncbi:MAG: hypothetical protein ACRD2I_26115 [Vicinamibacterales bacterium]